MHIRRAAAAEARTLSALAWRSKAHWGYAPAQMQAWRSAFRIAPGYLRAHPAFVAEEGGCVLGFYALEPGDGGWQLEHLWVDPQHMRRGVGRALLSHALRTAAAGGAGALLVEADPHAEAFYLACGASRVGELAAPIAGQPERVLPKLVFAIPSR